MKRIFEETSIADNRKALLSDRQRKGLWWDLANMIFSNAIFLFFLLSIVRSTDNNILFILGGLGIFVFLTVPKIVNQARDINQSSIYMVSGEVRKSVQLGGNTQLSIRVKDQSPLVISESLYTRIRNKTHYRFYITEYSNKVVNFECLDPDIESLNPSFDLKYGFYIIIKVLVWSVFLFLIASVLYYLFTHLHQ